MNSVLVAIAGVCLLGGCQQQQPAYIGVPHEVCGYVKEPVYGLLNRPSSDGEVLLGALAGAAAGKAATNKDGGALVGALIGGSIMADQRHKERVVIGHHEVYKCQTVYK